MKQKKSNAVTTVSYFIVLFGCGRILFSTHCFSPLLILLGDIFSTYLYHIISAFFMRQIPLGMKHKRDLDTSKMATKAFWCQSLELPSYAASCYYVVPSFLNFLQMKYMRVVLFRVTRSYSLKDPFTPVTLNQSSNSHQLCERTNREYP